MCYCRFMHIVPTIKKKSKKLNSNHLVFHQHLQTLMVFFLQIINLKQTVFI